MTLHTTYDLGNSRQEVLTDGGDSNTQEGNQSKKGPREARQASNEADAESAGQEGSEEARAHEVLSPDHIAKISDGRVSAAAVDAYLEFLDRPRRRIPSDEKLARIRSELPRATGFKKVVLLQQLADAETALIEADTYNQQKLVVEAEFIKHCVPVSERKHITYATWREAGIPASTLKKAGVVQTRL